MADGGAEARREAGEIRGLKLSVVGSGDAFGSGGRLQTCFHLAPSDEQAPTCLVDCGATVLVGLAALGLDARRIGLIVLTHLHGDHFAGVVWFLMHAQYIAHRTTPLIIAGPPGTPERLEIAREALYPGSTRVRRGFEVSHVTLAARCEAAIAGFIVTPYEVVHPAGAPSFAVSVRAGGRTFGYSGDTEWTDGLVAAAAGADLFACECSSFAVEVPHHLSWTRLLPQLHRFGDARVMVTHMGPEMLARRHEALHPKVMFAEDGLVLDV